VETSCQSEIFLICSPTGNQILLWVATLSSNTLTTMASISSPLSVSTRRLVTAFFALVVVVYAAPNLTVTLNYGTFQGAYSSSYNVSYWTKIPFAAPPVGVNRFRALQPPDNITDGIYNSGQAFDFCPQRAVKGTEDRLYLGLFSQPWSPTQPLRPVVVVYFGGAFIEGGGSFTIPPAEYPVLNVSSSNNFIFVYPNYRLNAFGFLPGKEIAADPHSDINAGLLDQQAALLWTHKHIEQFGGDPKNVSIWGQSASGGSVVAQVNTNGGKDQSSSIQ
jgi:carboxylesterase type B